MRLLLAVATVALVAVGCGDSTDTYMTQEEFLSRSQDIENRMSQLDATITYACSYSVTDNVRDKSERLLKIWDEVDEIGRDERIEIPDDFDWGFDTMPESAWQSFAHLAPDNIEAWEDLIEAITEALRDQGCNI